MYLLAPFDEKKFRKILSVDPELLRPIIFRTKLVHLARKGTFYGKNFNTIMNMDNKSASLNDKLQPISLMMYRVV